MMDKINAAIKYSYCICIAESDPYLATCIVPIIAGINKRAMPKLSHGDTANKYVTSALCAHVCLILLLAFWLRVEPTCMHMMTNLANHQEQ